MAAPKKVAAGARKPRKKVVKNITVGQAHIKSTFNNTIVSITDPSGAVIAWSSSGQVGFKGSRTEFADLRSAQGGGGSAGGGTSASRTGTSRRSPNSAMSCPSAEKTRSGVSSRT